MFLVLFYGKNFKMKTDVIIKPKKRKRGQWLSLLNKQGVYIIKNQNVVLYVGRSGNLYNRLISHFSNGGILNAFEYSHIEVIFTAKHKQLEKHLIDQLSPIFNGGLTSGIYKR